jgi:hypothetical protein
VALTRLSRVTDADLCRRVIPANNVGVPVARSRLLAPLDLDRALNDIAELDERKAGAIELP